MSKRQNLAKTTLFLTAFTITTFQSCLHNQYFDSSTSQCVNCQNYCDQCTNNSTNCTACVTGYYFANNVCLGCPQQCYSCNSSSICTACKQNYYMKSYSCLSCGKNCMLCTSVACNTCQTGYDISSNCLSCSKQFFFNSSLKLCDRCPIGCLDCANKTYCSKCDKKYLLVNRMCQFTGGNQTSNGQTQNNENNTQSSNRFIFFIILGVLAGFMVISCIACTAYYCVRNKLKKVKKQGDTKELKLVNRVSNTTLKFDKDSIIEQQNQFCFICKRGQIDLQSSCGHFFHKRCYQAEGKRCPVCSEDFSVAETYFQQTKNKQIELQYECSVKNTQQQQVYHNDRKKGTSEMDSLQ